MKRNPTQACVMFATMALLLALGGCYAGPDALDVREFEPDMDFPGQGEDDDGRHEFAEDLDELELGDPEAAGEIHVDLADIVVEVGEEVVINFSAEVWEIDPDDTYLTVSGAPDTADIDTTLGLFTWIPTPSDVGTHVLGIDLWWATEGRILDAQRIVIEVIPAYGLIEVGI